MSESRLPNSRIPSLDGLRGIAILMVMFGHGAYSFPDSFQPMLTFIGNGGLGVQIFFVLSGYLIYSLSVREIQKTGEFSWRQFYLRRAFRILPLYYTYLIVLLVLVSSKALYLTSTQLISAATFSLNYRHLWDNIRVASDYFVIGHYWTLALEEQFYLSWPLLMLLFSKKRLLATMLAIVISAPVIRVIVYVMAPDSRGQIGMMFHTGFDSIAAGVLLGELLRDQRAKYWIELFSSRSRNVVACLFFILFVSPAITHQLGGMYALPIGKSLELICVCLVISAAVLHRGTLLFRFLNWSPLVYVGILSYSLYVWNNLFLYGTGPWLVNVFPLNFLCVFVMAIISHYLIEMPFLRLKDRFHQSGNKGRV